MSVKITEVRVTGGGGVVLFLGVEGENGNETKEIMDIVYSLNFAAETLLVNDSGGG